MHAIAALLSVAAFTPTVPAASGAPQMIVHTDDLDLHSALGAAELRRRTEEAVLAMVSSDIATPDRYYSDPNSRLPGRRRASRRIGSSS